MKERGHGCEHESREERRAAQRPKDGGHQQAANANEGKTMTPATPPFSAAAMPCCSWWRAPPKQNERRPLSNAQQWHEPARRGLVADLLATKPHHVRMMYHHDDEGDDDGGEVAYDLSSMGHPGAWFRTAATSRRARSSSARTCSRPVARPPPRRARALWPVREAVPLPHRPA